MTGQKKIAYLCCELTHSVINGSIHLVDLRKHFRCVCVCHSISQVVTRVPTDTQKISFCVFIGPRYTWGPICGSECLSLTEVVETLLS